ncbi:uncharacterized protein [Amphiura filiformis]|uniref:uncharacterized protein n=1 Tax=Amphiura filiformis TaxID=82378 RepID=UPI003B21E062
MKDSWVSETMLQEASLAMEFPASPASQFNNSAAESPPKKSTELPINATQTEEKSCHVVKKHSEIAENQPPNQNIFCENQPMDTSENECNDDEEQIVPQIVASCPTSQQNMPEDMMVDGDEHREAANVSSRIMNLGLKDLLNESDHKHGGKDLVKAPVSSNQVNVIANTSTSYQHKNSTVIGNQWYGFPRQEHIIFGPLARSSASFPNTQSSSSISQSQFKERAGSPVITHKKFDYQKTLNLSNSNAPLNLCKRSPSSQSDKPSRQEEEESTPIDLTKKSTNKESDVQCPLQNPTSKYERVARLLNGTKTFY